MGRRLITNCPNCGAPITSWKCEYCDTVFDEPDMVTIQLNTQEIANAVRIEKLYTSAIKAMRDYEGEFGSLCLIGNLKRSSTNTIKHTKELTRNGKTNDY